MPAPMREVTRRNLISRARAAHEPGAAMSIHRLLDKRYKVLGRELRRAGLRKKLGRNLRNTGSMFKDDGDEDWSDWIVSFAQGVEEALTPFVVEDWMVETKYWNTRAVRPADVDPAKIFLDYQARTGKQITNIGADTQQRTLTAISSWYNTDESIPELIERLAVEFDEVRAETIARTESTNITSQVALDMYGQVGVGFYNIDVLVEGIWPCDDCAAAADGGPYAVREGPMPPFHPRCRCGTVATTEDGGVFFFGGDDLQAFYRSQYLRPTQSLGIVALRPSQGILRSHRGN